MIGQQKFRVRCISAFALLFFAYGAPAAQQVVEQTARLYASQSAASPIATVRQGQTVSIVREESSRVLVRYTEQIDGFMPSRYLVDCALPAASCGRASTVVNLRTGKGTSFRRLGQLKRGEEVLVIANADGYSEVRKTLSRSGWVDSSSLNSENAPSENSNLRVPRKGDSTTVSRPLALKNQLAGGATLRTLQPGDIVDVRENDGRYALVSVDSTLDGYLPAKYLEPCQLQGGNPQCFAATTTVNVRTGKGTQFRRIGQLKNGDVVEVQATEGSYARIRQLKSLQGWVLTAGLRKVTEDVVIAEATEPEDPTPEGTLPQGNSSENSAPPIAEAPLSPTEENEDDTAAAAPPTAITLQTGATRPTRFSVRATAGIGITQDKALDIQRALEANGTEGRVRGFDDEDTTLEISARYAFWRTERFRIGAELGYLDMGSYLVTLTTGNTSAQELARVLADNQPVADEGAILGTFGEYRLAPWLRLSAGVGGFVPFDTELVLEFNNERGVADSPSAGVLVSGGLSVPINRSLALGIYVRALRLNSWITSTSGGVEYRF